MTLYVFDMDGTLTPARLPMTAEFAIQFYEWQKTHKSFIASGSDEQKIREQLPPSVMNAFKGIYSSMGNVLTARGSVIYQKTFKPNAALFVRLESYRQQTAYPCALYPNYIEERIGMINFSVLGRNCPYGEREKYAAWDKTSHERETIATELRKEFPEYDIAVGGSISMDITPKGCGKGQIAAHLRQTYSDEKIVFFGDKTFVGGNDYELAQALRQLENTEVVQINAPEEVLMYLKNNGVKND
jgi:phosphomannomutase